MVCVSPRKSILRRTGKFGSKHAVKFSKGTWHQIEIRGRKGPSQEGIPKCKPHERSTCVPKFGKKWREETLHQERFTRRVAWKLANIFTNSRMRTKLRFMLLLKIGQCRRPLQNLHKSENSESIQEHQCTCWAKKKNLSSDHLDTLWRSRNSAVVVAANGEAQVFVHDFFSSSQCNFSKKR